MGIERYGGSIHILTEHNHYVGTVTGDEFIARDGEDIGSTWLCGGSRLRFRTEEQVSGRFSQDGRILNLRTGSAINVSQVAEHQPQSYQSGVTLVETQQ